MLYGIQLEQNLMYKNYINKQITRKCGSEDEGSGQTLLLCQEQTPPINFNKVKFINSGYLSYNIYRPYWIR